ncbi:MAG: ASKHA domain-containing protein [Deltaproteobacteria bacterium]|nr:ASKHA domain-containing protein [Deltaproteobacteria bacterium]
MDDRGRGAIRFFPGGTLVPLIPGATVLAHARRGSVPLSAPCGGEGRCGKCRVRVEGPASGGDDPGILSREDRDAGIRLACRCIPRSRETAVTVLPESRPARLEAWIDGKDLLDEEPFVPLYPAPAAGNPLGLALDLGTSTIAGALLDMRFGAILARASGDNPQMACGEDLISRIVFGEETPGGFDLLRRLLVEGIESVIADLLRAAGRAGEIVDVTAAGNTVISHLLCGLSPSPIRRPPHRPAVREFPPRTGRELGFATAPSAPWRIFPAVGGFVGGDIVSGLVASGMHRDESVSLLFDVGTNGEVALGNRDWRVACSSSAGPAFEGGEVACGMRAQAGAIDSVRIDRDAFRVSWTVIGGGRPKGVCGSGILDLCAELFRAGLLDRAGRFVPKAGAPFRETERGTAFVVADAGRSATGAPLLFAAPDVKSVLRTKAALCAAAEALLAAVGLPRESVARIYIAGGFGNFLDLRSAMTLGVFPPFPLDRFAPLGNASLAGAIGVLRSRRRWKEALSLCAATSYHDLSTDPGFMEAYQRALFIPHTEEERYRTALSPGTRRR